MAKPLSTLARATSAKAIDSHGYSVTLPDEWAIGSVPHGGFVTSCILSTASLHFSTTLSSQNQPHTITLYLTFLRRTSIGPATIVVQDSKLGRRTSTIHVELFSGPPNSPPCVVGYLTQSNLHIESGISLQTPQPLSPPPFPLQSTAALRADTDPNWVLLHPKPFASFRKVSQHAKIYLPRRPVAQALVDEWMCFEKEGERFTNESLGYVVDSFPQIVERYSPEELERAMEQAASPGSLQSSPISAKPAPKTKLDRSQWARFWYPTLLLNIEVKKALPPEGAEWLFVRVRSKLIKNGRMDLEVVVMDEGGDVVALSQHVALVLGAERNMNRNEGGQGKIKL